MSRSTPRDLSVLKDLFEKRNVTHVSIIDDVLDVPETSGLSQDRFERFVQEYNANAGLRAALGRSSSETSNTLPSFDDLSTMDLEPIWLCYRNSYLGFEPLSKSCNSYLCNLFEGHVDNVQEQLRSVRKILELFRVELGLSVSVYGNEDQNIAKIASTQIVIVDYFLVRDSANASYEKVKEFVEKVVNMARESNKPIPLFLLVSAHESSVDSERLRKGCKLMRSRFQFFPKSSVRSTNVEEMVRIYVLVGAFEGMETIEKLFTDWRCGVQDAVSLVHDQMLSLSISDLVCLDKFRLTNEGVSIGNYFRRFMTEYLSAIIDRKLDDGLWNDANRSDIFGLVREAGELRRELDGPVVSDEGPSEVMFEAYSSITFDDKRHDQNCSHIRSELMEGDVFVYADVSVVDAYDNARVLLVITPSCDLVQRREGEAPRAGSVVLLPGFLRYISGAEKGKDFSQEVVVQIKEAARCKTFRIEWQHRDPVTRKWEDIQKEGVARGFKRLGRVREPYFQRVRNDFTKVLTRIGTETPPLLPLSKRGKVIVTVWRGAKEPSYETVKEFSPDELMLWEIGSIRGIGDAKGERVYQVSLPFILALAKCLENVDSRDSDPELAKAAQKAAERLDSLEVWIDLLTSKKAGYRGPPALIRFVKATKSSEFSQNKFKKDPKCDLHIFLSAD